MPDHEILEVDVLFVGAGPAGLGGAIRLAQLAKAAGTALNITVIEKAKEIGAHSCSGAVMDPKSLRELIPDFEAQGAPIESPVEDDLVWFLTESEGVHLPFLPPSLRQDGNVIISLGQMVRWLGKPGKTRWSRAAAWWASGRATRGSTDTGRRRPISRPGSISRRR